MELNNVQEKIIYVLEAACITRTSMAGILGTLAQEQLDEYEFLEFISNKKDLTMKDCTNKLWAMRSYY